MLWKQDQTALSANKRHLKKRIQWVDSYSNTSDPLWQQVLTFATLEQMNVGHLGFKMKMIARLMFRQQQGGDSTSSLWLLKGLISVQKRVFLHTTVIILSDPCEAWWSSDHCSRAQCEVVTLTSRFKLCSSRCRRTADWLSLSRPVATTSPD